VPRVIHNESERPRGKTLAGCVQRETCIAWCVNQSFRNGSPGCVASLLVILSEGRDGLSNRAYCCWLLLLQHQKYAVAAGAVLNIDCLA
jgi:hypothetical protein